MSNQPVLFCFRNDLRLADNRGWHAAATSGHPVIALYVLDDQTPGHWKMGGASRWWLHHSLNRLNDDLAELGGSLRLRHGVWHETVANLAIDCDAAAVYWSRVYEPYATLGEKTLHDTLQDADITPKRFRGTLLFEPETVRTLNDDPYKVFTPFWKSCRKKPAPDAAIGAPKRVTFADSQPASDNLEDWALLPTRPDWASGLRDTWTPGETGAWERLEAFVDGPVANYKEGRDLPAVHGTSMLSPHLHFGELSPRQVWHAVHDAITRSSANQAGADVFLSEIGWREFSYHLLHHWPTLPDAPFKEKFRSFPWRRDGKSLRAWETGQTGIPIVDAGMRQLWHTGWMHNRVRMIVASLLIKNVLVHWRDGEDWFWDTLVDADLASNAAGWQWVAGSGADAAPYFRIFNPVTQSAKFDPEGHYLRRWVPEIADLPKKYIHDPSSAPAEILKGSGVILGQTYPRAIVDLKETRQRALDAYKQIK
ncbi:MAG: deoxyribodipyrimidine photo-lyase [Gammaproteobacteria bacterium]